jgi:SAM-dependent methyltransferase
MTSFKLFWLYRRNISDLLYVVLRRMICPFNAMEKIIRHGPAGLFADIGCGHGLFSLYCALRGRKIVGFEPLKTRLYHAIAARHSLKNVLFVNGLFSLKTNCLQGAFLSDVLHHCSFSGQQQLIKQVFDSLKSGGTLVIKEICTNDGLSFRLSSLSDRFLYQNETCCFHSRTEWIAMLVSCGFTVTTAKIPSLFSTNLFIARR